MGNVPPSVTHHNDVFEQIIADYQYNNFYNVINIDNILIIN